MYPTVILLSKVSPVLPSYSTVFPFALYPASSKYFSISFSVAPSNTGLLISCGSYNSNTGSLAIDSSRGFPRNAVKPDFTAPGVEILGPLPRKRYGRKSGTSVSGAITAGIAALMLEWGIMQKNDMQINTTRIKNYLIRGARRDPERIYPNREWGYGQVDLYETFLGIR